MPMMVSDDDTTDDIAYSTIAGKRMQIRGHKLILVYEDICGYEIFSKVIQGFRKNAINS
jgi:hypothetical protein